MKPRHIAYIIWIVIALLGVVCYFIPEGGWTLGKYTLRFPTLTEALDLQRDTLPTLDSAWLANLEEIPPQDSLLIQEPLKPQPTQTPAPTAEVKSLNKQDTTNIANTAPAISPPTIDTRTYLTAFYAALDSASNMPVRVVHYGDSQIEEDRITNILREHWQKEYGGGGIGLIPLHQTIPTRSIRQWITINGVAQSVQKGPKRYLVYGPKSMRFTTHDDYGVMGQVALMDSTILPGSETITLNITPIDNKRKPHNYFNRVRVLTDSIRVNDLEWGMHDVQLADSTTHCEILLRGKGNVYGISLETPTGIIVDNIPMRGCYGTVFTKIDSAQLSNFYRETNTRLIILQFGGNMIPQTQNPSTISGYVRHTLRQQVRYIRACAPQASILFIGPSDMATNIDGKMTTYPLVPYMDKMLRKMAAEEHIAYWSMYDAMGGYGSMVTWHDKGLAGSDYVHFTRSGANNIGKKLYQWINEARPADSRSMQVPIDSLSSTASATSDLNSNANDN